MIFKRILCTKLTFTWPISLEIVSRYVNHFIFCRVISVALLRTHGVTKSIVHDDLSLIRWWRYTAACVCFAFSAARRYWRAREFRQFLNAHVTYSTFNKQTNQTYYRQAYMYNIYIAPQAAYSRCSGARFCATDRADVQPIGRTLSLHPQTLTCDQTALRSPGLPLMLLTPVILVITRITTHLQTRERYKAELAWLVDP